MGDGDTLFDALVIGAGPAGVSAALRLQQLGHSVLLVERSAVWPRAQVGEALTPGVRNIIELLDANDALAEVPHVAHAGSRVLWRSRTPDLLQQAGSAIVDRGRFDAALLALARRRGVELEQPARLLHLAGAAGDWRASLLCAETRCRQVRARYILDASGRGAASRIDCAPRLAAIWGEVDQSALAQLDGATQVEALEHGWLWAGCLPGRRYRLMLVCDPHAARQAGTAAPEARLRAACANSQLLRAAAGLPLLGAVQMCSATPYLAPDSWQDGRLKLGDAAFALDPVSSSGVEKAMRFSLQAAVALHTVLGDERPERHALARRFFEGRLVEACARHAHWTEAYYGQAWCADQPFWQARARCEAVGDGAERPELLAALSTERARLAGYQPPELKPLAGLNPARPLRLHGGAAIVELPCVVDDRVCLQQALDHPHLERPLAFLENEALFPHLARLAQPLPLAQLLQMLADCMPGHKAERIAAWLWQRGLLESVG
ncbi:tryptophan 7-halogenase [Duganella violaceipulchra]|uniref:2-polyprenyl-6-methoxyphenol hydroxylase-like FAD-dependent oxidoreductase n=1 Tax=Duganella violaceipulchra TaxID=2849652 RepID=A0AA41HB00_9BURK|nr:tryptophan 7-halogenase [Duganella violaceicalia]MBV6323266.1 tryptophan 7-halogenase [Duganella violaceicalia]MCP2007784.1 2-polyprenyl-6-methoxyphenol hydroxylase-like FAD-dependent oxidoreductase [Duganella violaceicalia]